MPNQRDLLDSLNPDSFMDRTPMATFYLLTDSKFLYSFLVNKWLSEFAADAGFGGLLIRADPPGKELEQRRREFHDAHHGKREVSADMDAALQAMYPDFGSESRASIASFGIPRYGFSHAERVVYLGADLNGERARRWVETNLLGSGAWVFSHVGQILAPWWVAHAAGRLLNMHSAVLPYARGANAVQQVAALGDEARLREVAGATIHFIDEGVDTGGLIRAERLAEPLACTDLWALVAAIYDLGDSLYVQTARDIVSQPGCQADSQSHSQPGSLPVGFQVAPDAQGPNYLRKDFTPARCAEAEASFSAMRAAWLKRRSVDEAVTGD